MSEYIPRGPFKGRVSGFGVPSTGEPLFALAGGAGDFAGELEHIAVESRSPSSAGEDPVSRAFAQGYAQGADEARAAALAEAALADAARHRIETALSRLDAALVDQLQDRLRETVVALCEAAIAPAAIDPVALAARVTTAAAMLARAEDARVIRLHPEDLALVGNRLPEDWHFEPDPALERGSVRVEGANGGVEDGPEHWRRALAEALRQC